MKHGLTGYVHDRCRCDICREASKQARRRAYLRNREQIRARNDAYDKAHPEVGRAARAKWKATHPDRAREIQAAADKKQRATNLEIIKARQKAWYDADPAKRIAVSNAWKKANRERMNATRLTRNRANPQKARDQVATRRARKAGVDNREITERDWQRLCQRYDNRCAYCGAEALLTQDHIMPIIRGGRHAIGNLLPACKTCNSSKKTSLLVEWRRRLAASTQLAS